ncbi:HlyC/CorC family transporter [Paraferrimonas sp. SM1919]|uniref:HlyC/CorC family transporter n=1 Tax=Paraferrimonas sp. SM1919 TaxID=2662263 RepID=UPI0013D3C533|nr:CNNM domain-containing protein [Paraferrimonas sp. SM1919]
MEAFSTLDLILILILLLLVSAYFSGSETAMMSLNRYRLRHLAKQGHKGAKRSAELLDKPDRLIGLILIGNNAVNIFATVVATILGLRFFDQYAEIFTTVILTITVLIFSEVTPKTLSALYPERVAFPSSRILKPLLWIMTPLVKALSLITNGLLRIFGVKQDDDADALNPDELRSVVNEAGNLIPKRHQDMLLSILDLERVTVEDIMVPRSEIYALNINSDFRKLTKGLIQSPHTRVVLFRDNIDDIVGIVHIRDALRLLTKEQFDKHNLLKAVKEVYYIPEGTPLNVQLLKFQNNHEHTGLVVDEYGDIQGLVSLEDILEEIVGDFTTTMTPDPSDEIHPQDDGSYIIEAAINIRELNKELEWELPLDGPKTLNGLILEHLEDIPMPKTTLELEGHSMEVLDVEENMIKLVKIQPTE